MVSVLLAMDKFKGCLTAAQVDAALAAGMQAAVPGLQIRTVPVADGGEGTVDVALSAGYEARHAHVSGPSGEQVMARWAQYGTRAVLELAAASGLTLVSGEPQAGRASTFGTGQLIAAALDAGCREVIVGLGGSATTDTRVRPEAAASSSTAPEPCCAQRATTGSPAGPLTCACRAS